MTAPHAIVWEDGDLLLLDQRRLPSVVAYEPQKSLEEVVQSIRTLVVRGAPAIGITAAYGMVIAASQGIAPQTAAVALKAARPTAVNLAWAVDRLLAVIGELEPNADVTGVLCAEAQAIHAEDRAMCRAIGEHAAHLIVHDSAVLTHCNAGALAVSELGTATAPMYVAHSAGVGFRVYVDETRPVLQGARLTAWELNEAGIDVTLICDAAAPHLMSEGAIQLAIVGADRVAANGDVVNKIGTRGLAIACAYHDIPFYVALPSSTYDPDTPCGADVKIEERGAEEVTGPIATVANILVRNPAFDVTPAGLVTGYLTEHGALSDITTITDYDPLPPAAT